MMPSHTGYKLRSIDEAKYGAKSGLAPFLEKARIEGLRLEGDESKQWQVRDFYQSIVYFSYRIIRKMSSTCTRGT